MVVDGALECLVVVDVGEAEALAVAVGVVSGESQRDVTSFFVEASCDVEFAACAEVVGVGERGAVVAVYCNIFEGRVDVERISAVGEY